MSERHQRLVFGEVAELYDASRPTYPEALIDDLVTWAGEPPRALEIGAGTGKATRRMAARGVSVVAIEPSANMAAIARRTTAAYPGVEVVESDFEHFVPGGERFALIYAAQAWHWVDHTTGYARARAALRHGGVLTAFWNRPAWDETAIRDALLAAYDEIVPGMARDGPMHPGGSGRGAEDDWQGEIDAAGGFAEAEIRDYAWAAPYTAERFADLLGTVSEIRMLDAPVRERLLDVARRAVADVGGAFELPIHTRTCIARAV